MNDTMLFDAMLRMIGAVYTVHCDVAGPEKAAKAVDAMYRWAELNSDNPLCAKFCIALADAQAEHNALESFDFRKLMSA
jgi:hypothetical protein